MHSSTNSPGQEYHNGRSQVHPMHTTEGGTITQQHPIPLLICHPTIHLTMGLTQRALPVSRRLCCSHRTITQDIQITVRSTPLSLVGLIIIIVVSLLEVMKNLMATLPYLDELAPSPMLPWLIWPHNRFHHLLVLVIPQWRCLLVSNGFAEASICLGVDMTSSLTRIYLLYVCSMFLMPCFCCF